MADQDDKPRLAALEPGQWAAVLRALTEDQFMDFLEWVRNKCALAEHGSFTEIWPGQKLLSLWNVVMRECAHRNPEAHNIASEMVAALKAQEKAAKN